MVTEQAGLIESGFTIMQRLAGGFARGGNFPPGVSEDDLQSLGSEELMKAAKHYDPAAGKPWAGFLTRWLQFRFRSFLAKARKRAARTTTLEVVMPDGSEEPRPDPKAKNPAGRAARREESQAGRKALAAAAVRAALPAADEVAAKANELRRAMYAAVAAGDMRNIMEAMIEKASAGDVRAAQFVVATLVPPSPPPPPVVNIHLPVDPDDD